MLILLFSTYSAQFLYSAVILSSLKRQECTYNIIIINGQVLYVERKSPNKHSNVVSLLHARCGENIIYNRVSERIR